MNKPTSTLGLWHVALNVVDLAAVEHFYVALMGMTIEWRPDADNVYLTGGKDNLALHKVPTTGTGQALDHIGFFVAEAEQVDVWHAWLLSHDIQMKTKPRTHRDGARSFYCYDPAGNTVQILHHPPICQAVQHSTM